MSAAAAYASRRAGTVTFAVKTPGRLYGRGVGRVVPSASVLKAMLLVAYLRRHSVRHRALRRADLRLLSPMIRRSDDDAASTVDRIVGDSALWGLAARAHMRRFHPESPWACRTSTPPTRRASSSASTGSCQSATGARRCAF